MFILLIINTHRNITNQTDPSEKLPELNIAFDKLMSYIIKIDIKVDCWVTMLPIWN